MENEVKEPAPKYNYISPEEYLALERKASFKSEYFHGQVLAMAGASLRHNLIESNIIGHLSGFLAGKKCTIMGSNMRVSNPSGESYMYPDALIYCGDPILEDDKFDTLTNPLVIFEILSPSATGIDKGRKVFFYQQIPSLLQYIMVDSQKRFIQIARRQPDLSWKMETLDEKYPDFEITPLNFHFSLDKCYQGTGL
jgi:Uma2 family endonuclease